MTDKLPGLFIIKRARIELRVILQPNGTVSIVPHNCKPENLRLCSVIARTQNALVQIKLDTNKETQLDTFLLSFFDGEGWDVTPMPDPIVPGKIPY
jgi:hypothetical protein